MTRIGTSIAGLIASLLLASLTARAADDPQLPDLSRRPVNYLPPQKSVSAIDVEFGARYWFSVGKTAKNLYGAPGAAMVSRLTYGGLQGHAAEGFGRIDHIGGIYVKGYLGVGIVPDGHLNDEDFAPGTVPYSSTMSGQRSGQLLYGSIDLGYNVVRNNAIRIGVFGGYHGFQEKVNAYGCAQIASNSEICGGAGIPESVKIITQDNTYHSLRVGMDADIRLTDRLALRLDGAYLPYVVLRGTDAHWLRIGTTPNSFTGPTPDDGPGHGYQFETALHYAVNQNVSFAVGGRYWHMETKGNSHFEGHVVGATAAPQPVEWKSDIYGVFVQGSYKFGQY